MFLFKKIPSISTNEIERKLAEKVTIIDVREPHEFVNGHIPGAKNVPLNKVRNYQPKGKIYVICQSGMRSKRATKELIQNGFDAVNIKGGMLRYSGATRGGKY
ncbi:rhodanese-like domain-containing protein [Isobaculum melis]|uniref:Rhodanese-related sulfurtransferase n=1 Tax=Isobaculum melis TaxID=142588 RepID=A0A1H9QHS1_9LACT|nr:rhodanese-like domain-containing protein [Isobaculum melis]SER59967.1 Rhodanese-related sulfurtransferase [Isobaculum melis]